MNLERTLAVAAHRLLVRRGWIVQLNTPDQCTNPYDEIGPDGNFTGRRLIRGWRPDFSARTGRIAVYRDIGEHRLTRNFRRRIGLP